LLPKNKKNSVILQAEENCKAGMKIGGKKAYKIDLVSKIILTTIKRY